MLLHSVATVAAKRCCSKLQSVAPALQLLSMDNGAHASASTKRTEGSAPFERGSNLGIDSTDQRGRRLLDWRRPASRLRASTLINRPEGRRAGISARPRREHDDRHAGNSDAGTNEIPSRELGAVNEPQPGDCNGDVDTAGPLLSTARSPAPAARDQRRQLIQSSATQQLIVVTNRRFCARRSEPRLLR